MGVDIQYQVLDRTYHVRVFKYRLLDEPEVYHALAVDRMDAILDICELYACAEEEITDLQEVERLSARITRTQTS